MHMNQLAELEASRLSMGRKTGSELALDFDAERNHYKVPKKISSPPNMRIARNEFDILPAIPTPPVADSNLRSEHPLMQVSSEYMRVIGAQRPKKFLSKRITTDHDDESLTTVSAPVASSTATTVQLSSVSEHNGSLPVATVGLDPGAQVQTNTPANKRRQTYVDVESGLFGGGGVAKLLSRHTRRRKPGRRSSLTPTPTAENALQDRLTLRKILYAKRTRVTDYATFFGVIGVCLAVVDAELRANAVIDHVRYHPTSRPTTLCKF